MTHNRTTSLPIGGYHPPIGTRAVFELRIPERGDRYAIFGGAITTATQDRYRSPGWVLVGLLDNESAHDNSVVIDDRYRNATVTGDGPGDAHLRRT